METGCQTTLGILVHVSGADLKLNDLPSWRLHRRVQALVAVWFGVGDVIFDALVKRLVHFVQHAQHQVASC